ERRRAREVRPMKGRVRERARPHVAVVVIVRLRHPVDAEPGRHAARSGGDGERELAGARPVEGERRSVERRGESGSSRAEKRGGEKHSGETCFHGASEVERKAGMSEQSRARSRGIARFGRPGLNLEERQGDEGRGDKTANSAESLRQPRLNSKTGF